MLKLDEENLTLTSTIDKNMVLEAWEFYWPDKPELTDGQVLEILEATRDEYYSTDDEECLTLGGALESVIKWYGEEKA